MKSTSWNKSKERDKQEPLEENGANESGGSLRTTWYFWVFVGLIAVGAISYLVWSYLESQYVLTTGRVVGQTTEVRAEEDGEISTVHVSEGASVEQNQLLITLENNTLRSKYQEKQAEFEEAKQRLQTLKRSGIDPELQTKISSARQSIRQLQSRQEVKELQLKRLRQKRQDLKEKVGRFENLYMMEAVSTPEYREVQSKYEDMNSQVNELETTISGLESELKEQKNTLQKLKASVEYHRKKRKQRIREKQQTVKHKKQAVKSFEKTLERLTVRAPRRGIVQNVRRNEGEQVGKHETLLILGSSQNKWIIAYIPVQKYPVIYHGQSVRVEILGDRTNTLEGEVDLRRSPLGSDESKTVETPLARSPSDLESRMVPVRINLKQPSVALRSGMVVRLRISLKKTYFTWF